MRSPLSSTASTSPSSLSNHFSIITSISLTSVWLQERQKDYPQEQRRIPIDMNIQVQSVSYLIQPIVGGYQICLVFQHKALEWIWVQSLHCERFQQGYKVLKLRNFIFKLYHHVFKIWKKFALFQQGLKVWSITWIWPACKSIVTTWSAPAAERRSATSLIKGSMVLMIGIWSVGTGAKLVTPYLAVLQLVLQ